MTEQAQDEKAIFLAALEKTPPQRNAFVEEACADDPELLQRLREILKTHDESIGPLDSPPPGIDATIDRPVAEKPGTLIGRYKLREQIGEGGMGVVYVAEQTKPVQRKVALKIIKPGMDTRQVIARFEAERQALALMDHPNIARVLDAGATESGRPYFVMELVRGMPITDYCDQAKLTTDERLGLLAKVCQAVQHAHQKGIIHRDIKPSNVMITLHDGVPVPKIIDFGVAKATGQRLTEQSVYTQLTEMIGTPLYMSPEQAELSGLDIDTRSDVYSLGVLLYELLTGTTPFDRATLREAGFDELRRIIREQEPPKPSDRLDTIEAASLSTISERRGIDPRKLTHTLRGDLDWIVMKALEKDRTRRYETASALAADVSRYLVDEPIEACPPSAGYRFKKFARRNRTMFTAGAAAIVALVVGAAVATDQAIRATRAEGVAEDRLDVAEKQKRLAQRQTKLAEAQERETARHRDAADQNLYLAEMRLAYQDWQSGQVSRLYELLDRHLPQPDRPDRRGWEWYYLLSLCHKDSQALLGHAASISSVVWSPDGQRLASASDDGTVKIWDAVTRQEILTLPASGVYFVAWSPDGQRLASGSNDGMVKIWDATTGDELLTLRGHAGAVRPVAWSPNGRRLASGDSDGKVKIWDAATAEEILTFGRSDKGVFIVAWSPDGKRLASGEGPGMLTTWDAATGEELGSWRAHEHDLWGLDWSPDGRRLATGSYDGQLKVFEASTGEALLTIAHSSGVESVAWSPDGKRLASATRSQRIRVWDVSTGKEVLTLRGHQGWVKSVDWIPDGQRLASGGRDRTVRIWDISADQQTPTPRHDEANSIAWSPATDRLATAGGGRIKIWDASTHRELLSLEASERFAWSPDGRRLAIESTDQTVKILDASSGKEVLTLGAGSASPIPRAFVMDWSPDGKRLALAVQEHGIEVYNTETGQEGYPLRGHTKEVWAVRWSPDGRRLASAGRDGTVIIWDVATRQKRVTFRGHPPGKWIRSIAWSPDGTRLASGGWDQTVKVWDTSNGHELLLLGGHTGAIRAVDWSPHGERLATCSADETLKIWDMSTGQELLTLKEPGTKVEAVDWSPDGKRLASVSSDGAIKIFDASFGYEFAETATYRHERALGLAGSGRHQQAIAIFKTLVAEFPDVPDYRRQLAGCYRKRAAAYHNNDEFDKAIVDYSESLQLDPDNARVYLLRSVVYYSQKKYDLALADCNKALKLKPDCAEAYANRGVLYRRQEQYDLALANCDKALKLNPNYAEAYKERIVIYREREQYDLALADCNKALELNPNYAEAYNDRGLVYDSQKQYDLALADCNKALELNPDYAEAYNTRGAVYHSRKQDDLALEDCNKALELKPDYANAYNNRGVAYYSQKKYDLALQDYNEALKLDPEYAIAYGNRGLLYYSQKKYDLALANYNTMLELKPNYALGYFARGDFYHQRKQYDLALEDYNKALRLNPDYVEAYNRRGIVHYRREEYDLALADFTEAIRIDPKGHLYYRNRGVVYRDKGQFDKAIADHTEAIRIDPEIGRYHGDLAKSLLKSDQMGKASELFEDLISRQTAALASNPQDQQGGKRLGSLYHALAEVLLELGDYCEAAKAEGQAWDASPAESRKPVFTRSLLASCVALAEKDDSLAEDQREALVKTYTDRIEELTQRIEELLDPPYAPAGKLIYLDLQPQTNAKLAENFHAGEQQNNLAELPQGEQVFAGVKFRIGDGLIQLAGQHLSQRPEKVAGIRVHKTFAKLYIFHATAWEAADGTPIGRYDVHYEDRTAATIPVVYGEDVRNWYRSPIDPRAVARGRVAWVGTNPASKRANKSLRLYVTRWENPHPEKKVIGIDYRSTNTKAAPFCVAMTVEQPAEPMAEKAQAADSLGIEEPR